MVRKPTPEDKFSLVCGRSVGMLLTLSARVPARSWSPGSTPADSPSSAPGASLSMTTTSSTSTPPTPSVRSECCTLRRWPMRPG